MARSSSQTATTTQPLPTGLRSPTGFGTGPLTGEVCTGGLVPDLTILLDLDVEIGLKRKKKNGDEWNRMDAHEVEFYERVRAGYLEMVKQEPNRWVVVNSEQKWDDVQRS